MDNRVVPDPQMEFDAQELEKRCIQARARRYRLYLIIGACMLVIFSIVFHTKHKRRIATQSTTIEPATTSKAYTANAHDCWIDELTAPKNQRMLRVRYDPACWTLLIKQNPECQIQSIVGPISGGEMHFVFTCPPTPAAQ